MTILGVWYDFRFFGVQGLALQGCCAFRPGFNIGMLTHRKPVLAFISESLSFCPRIPLSPLQGRYDYVLFFLEWDKRHAHTCAAQPESSQFRAAQVQGECL